MEIQHLPSCFLGLFAFEFDKSISSYSNVAHSQLQMRRLVDLSKSLPEPGPPCLLAHPEPCLLLSGYGAKLLGTLITEVCKQQWVDCKDELRPKANIWLPWGLIRLGHSM